MVPVFSGAIALLYPSPQHTHTHTFFIDYSGAEFHSD